jgi:serine/threonine protein kinase
MLERWLEVLSGARTREDFTPTTFKQQLPHSKYEFVSVLGKGGFAVVWKAFHKSTHTWVAIKVIDLDKLKHLGKLPETHIDRECDIMKSINHPNIVQLIEIYDDCDPELGRGKLFLVLEYLNGIDLQRRLDNGPPLNHETEAKEVLLQIGGALHYLHTLVCGGH